MKEHYKQRLYEAIPIDTLRDAFGDPNRPRNPKPNPTDTTKPKKPKKGGDKPPSAPDAGATQPPLDLNALRDAQSQRLEETLVEHYKQRLEQRMLEEGFLGNLASRVTAPMRGAIKRDVQAIGTAVRRAPGAIGQAVKTTATSVGQRLSSLAQSAGRKLAPIGNQILDRAGDALRASGALDKSNKPNSVIGILAQGAGRMLAARAANRTRLGLRMDTASPEQRAALQGRAQSAAARSRVAALTPERRAALKARLGGGQTTTERPRVTAAPDREARRGGAGRNAASAVALRRGMEDRSIIQGLRRLARSGDRDAASKLATRQEASARTKERLKGKLGALRQRQAQAAAGGSGGGRREPAWVGRARFNDRMRQKGEVRRGPNTSVVTQAKADRAAKRKQRQELRSGDADKARAAGRSLLGLSEQMKMKLRQRMLEEGLLGDAAAGILKTARRAGNLIRGKGFKTGGEIRQETNKSAFDRHADEGMKRHVSGIQDPQKRHGAEQRIGRAMHLGSLPTLDIPSKTSVRGRISGAIRALRGK